MNRGRFFKLSKNVDLTGNQIQFDYTGFMSDIKPYYHVYLVFRKHCIDFYFNGYLYVKNNGNDHPEELTENMLFSLNLQKGKENEKQLNETLKELYSNEFPILNKYSLEKSKTNKLKYKNLLLDFLFDAFHSDVFMACSAFSEIKQRINEHVFFKAISHKADFYYNRENLAESSFKTFSSLTVFEDDLKCKNPKYSINFSDTLRLENIIKSQERWFDTLFEKNNNNIIKKNNKWFFDIESEVEQAFNNVRIKSKKKEKKNKEIEINKKKEKKKDEKNINEIKTDYNKKLSKLRNKAVDWSVSRNNLLLAWKSGIRYKIAYWLLIVIAIFITIVYFVPSVVLESFNIYYNEYIKNLPEILMIFISLLFTILIFSQIRTLFFRFTKLLMIPFWGLLAGSSYIVFEISTFYNKHLLLNNFTYKFGYILLGLLLVIVIFNVLINIKCIKVIQCLFKIIKLRHKLKLFKFCNYIDISKIKPKTKKIITIVYIIIIFLLFGTLYLESINSYVIVFLLISLITFLLYKNERDNHPNLEESKSLKKSSVMLFYGLIISLIVNLFLYNIYYKEFLEHYAQVGEIWEQVYHNSHINSHKETHNNLTHKKHNSKKEQNNHSDSTEITKKSIFQTVYNIILNDKDVKLQYSYNKKMDSDTLKKTLKEIIRVSNSHLSDSVEVFIDNHFFDQLEYVYVVSINNNGHEQNNKNTDEKYYVLKEININGFKFKVLPSVLFFNTFISLLVAAILQTLFHKRKFLLGGEAE